MLALGRVDGVTRAADGSGCSLQIANWEFEIAAMAEVLACSALHR
jgi:hypothetical protein